MIALIFFTGLISSLLLIDRSWSLHYFFVFCLFFVASNFFITVNVLNDILIYRDAFNIVNKKIFILNQFIFLLELLDQLDFTLVYATTMALSQR